MSRKWQTADIFRDFLPSFDMFHRLSLFFVRNGNVWESTITSHMGDRGLLLNKNCQTLLVGCQTIVPNYLLVVKTRRRADAVCAIFRFAVLIFCHCTRKYCFFLHFAVKIDIFDEWIDSRHPFELLLLCYFFLRFLQLCKLSILLFFGHLGLFWANLDPLRLFQTTTKILLKSTWDQKHFVF